MNTEVSNKGISHFTKQCLIAGLASVLLSACYSDFQRPGATDADKFHDESACRVEAEHQAPPNLQTKIDPGYTTETYRGTRHDWHGDKYDVYSNSYTPPTPVTVDVNEEQRQSLFNLCMANRGWSPK